MDNLGQPNWKKRALERRIENKLLKKRIKELKASRDMWKTKAKAATAENDLTKTKYNKLIIKLKNLLAQQ